MFGLNKRYENIRRLLWDYHKEDRDLWYSFSFELEEHMCWNDKNLMKNCPKNIKKAFQQDQKDRYPSAVSYHPLFGYFHISSGGQGPCIGEYEDENIEKLKERISKLNDEQKRKYLNENYSNSYSK